MSYPLKIAAAFSSAIVFSTITSSAAVQQTSDIDLTSMTAFPASATDLINIGQPSFLGVERSDGTAPPLQTPAIHDGTVGTHGTSLEDSEYMSYDGATFMLRFNLNTALNPLGYDISSITAISGSTLYRTNQVFGVAFELVDGSTVGLGLFSKTIVVDSTPVGDAAGQTFTYASIRTVINDSENGLLASGVKAVLLDIRPESSSLSGNDLGTRYREFDVVGSATVPEPTSLGLLSGMALMALKRRRAR